MYPDSTVNFNFIGKLSSCFLNQTLKLTLQNIYSSGVWRDFDLHKRIRVGIGIDL